MTTLPRMLHSLAILPRGALGEVVFLLLSPPPLWFCLAHCILGVVKMVGQLLGLYLPEGSGVEQGMLGNVVCPPSLQSHFLPVVSGGGMYSPVLTISAFPSGLGRRWGVDQAASPIMQWNIPCPNAYWEFAQVVSLTVYPTAC